MEIAKEEWFMKRTEEKEDIRYYGDASETSREEEKEHMVLVRYNMVKDEEGNVCFSSEKDMVQLNLTFEVSFQ